MNVLQALQITRIRLKVQLVKQDLVEEEVEFCAKVLFLGWVVAIDEILNFGS